MNTVEENPQKPKAIFSECNALLGHTPGPWAVEFFEPDGITVFADNGSGPRSVCDIIGDMPVDVANARLIAAAPEMLHVLQLILLCDITGGGVIAAKKAAAAVLQPNAPVHRKNPPMTNLETNNESPKAGFSGATPCSTGLGK